MVVNIMHKKNLLLDSIGYENLYDFLTTIFAVKEKTLSIPIFSAVLTFWFTIISNFIDKAIYSPSLAIIILFITSLLDTILGASAAVKNGLGLDAYKLGRSAVRFIVQVSLVALLYQLSILYIIIPKQVVDVFLLIFTLSTLWSCINNSFRLDLITKEQYTTLQGVVSFKKLIGKFTKK